MYTLTKAEQLVAILTKETFAGNIKWFVTDVPVVLKGGNDYFYSSYFQAEYQSNTIGIFLRRAKHYIDEDQFYWSDEVGVCILTNVGTLSFINTDRSPMLGKLLDTVMSQASGLDSILRGSSPSLF